MSAEERGAHIVGGRLISAIEDLSDALKFARSRRAGLENEPRILADLANAYRLNGDIVTALSIVGEAIEVATERHARVPECLAQGRCDKRRQKDVVTCASRVCILIATIEPPAGSQRAQNMFVRAPGEKCRSPFGSRPGVGRDSVCDRTVGARRTDGDRRHYDSPWSAVAGPGEITDAPDLVGGAAFAFRTFRHR
jgi:hypothetical protein